MKIFYFLFHRLINENKFSETLFDLFNKIKCQIKYYNQSMGLYPQDQGKRLFTSSMSSYTDSDELESYNNFIS